MKSDIYSVYVLQAGIICLNHNSIKLRLKAIIFQHSFCQDGQTKYIKYECF